MSSVACSFSLKRVRARVGNSPGRVYRSDRPIYVDPVSRPISDLIAYLISHIGASYLLY